jgi:hypothetical protein
MSIWIMLSIWMLIRIHFLFGYRSGSCVQSCFPFIRILLSLCVDPDPGPAFLLDTNPDHAFRFVAFQLYVDADAAPNHDLN